MGDQRSKEKKFLILQEISSVIAATKDIHTLAYLLLDRAIGYTDAEKGSSIYSSFTSFSNITEPFSASV